METPNVKIRILNKTKVNARKIQFVIEIGETRVLSQDIN
jgi:hypothetical protein